eukprot:6769273-Lingulodinium_polyedra.AAC.1
MLCTVPADEPLRTTFVCALRAGCRGVWRASEDSREDGVRDDWPGLALFQGPPQFVAVQAAFWNDHSCDK